MYGLIGKIRVIPGKRGEFAQILLDGLQDMPGCYNYVVANDPDDADALWVTEVWQDQESHENSLSLPSVQAAIAQGRPLIAGFDARYETEPVGGHGLFADR